jgi:class 3 adenylate cyclase
MNDNHGTQESGNGTAGLSLERIPLFERVSPEALGSVTPDMVRHFRHGDTIFRDGDGARHMVVILEGRACVTRGDTFITCRAAPEVVGEQAFIDDTARSAMITAQGFVRALMLPEATVRGLMKDYEFICNLLRALSCKLREATEERERHYRREELLFSEFKAHASEEMIDSLLETGVDYGKPRYIEDAVILFSDIRNFTPLSAGMSAGEVAEQLSLYLSAVVDTIHRHDGLVDKFVGDAVMAVWGYTPSTTKAADAFRCAEELVRVASEMRFGGHPIRIGVGLNSGEVFSGNVGNEGKKQFTVLGAPVNLAARFEGKAKELNAPIVAGTAFYEALPPELQRLLTPHKGVSVKGDSPQTLYTFDPAAGGKGQSQ